MANYYLRFRQRVTGPFSAQELRSMAANGKLTGMHMLSADKQQWTPADQVKGLFPKPEGEAAPAAAAAPEAAGSATAHCRTCGATVLEGAAVCVGCGMPPGAGRAFCRNCGAETHPQAVTCVRCGVPLGGAPSAGYGLWGGFLRCLDSRYADFKGRSSRTEYWGFSLFLLLFAASALGLIWLLARQGFEGAVVLFTFFYALAGAIFVPSLAAMWRRFHDAGVNGGLALLSASAAGAGCGWLFFLIAVRMTADRLAPPIPTELLVPALVLAILGMVPFLVVACMDSVPGKNRYGPNPKGR